MTENTKIQIVVALSVTDRANISSALRQVADAIGAGQTFDQPHPIAGGGGAQAGNPIGTWHVQTR